MKKRSNKAIFLSTLTEEQAHPPRPYMFSQKKIYLTYWLKNFFKKDLLSNTFIEKKYGAPTFIEISIKYKKTCEIKYVKQFYDKKKRKKVITFLFSFPKNMDKNFDINSEKLLSFNIPQTIVYADKKYSSDV